MIKQKKYKKCALAIIKYKNKFLLQLRDNKNHIRDPNMWGLFGGSINRNEKPMNALKRELIEELNHNFMSIKKFTKIFYKKDKMECYIYFINTNNKKFALKEGQEYNFFLLNDILLGSIYSKITKKSHNLTFITYKAIKRLKLQGSK